jgi:hypothetical protein
MASSKPIQYENIGLIEHFENQKKLFCHFY